MRSQIKRIAHWFGSGVAILGVIFVTFKLYEYSDKVDHSLLSLKVVTYFCFLSVGYMWANLFLAIAWRDLLAHLGVNKKKIWAIKIYGISQIAKYVPGNIFHFASRQALGTTSGISSLVLVKSTLWELGVLVFTGTLYSTLIIPFWIDNVSSVSAVVIFLLLFTICIFFAWRGLGFLVVRAIVGHSVFLFFSGLIFTGILLVVVPSSGELIFLFPSICGAYVVAWLVGLVTPGAPAGVGVREVILFAMLGSLIAESDLLSMIVLGRCVTVFGDVLFYFISLIVKVDGSRYPCEESDKHCAVSKSHSLR